MNQESEQAIDHLRKGNVILYPTDTIWGLGCDPSNQVEVERMFDIYLRPPSLHFFVIVYIIQILKTILPRIHPRLEDILYYNFRPLILIYENIIKEFARGLHAADGSLAIRLVHH